MLIRGTFSVLSMRQTRRKTNESAIDLMADGLSYDSAQSDNQLNIDLKNKGETGSATRHLKTKEKQFIIFFLTLISISRTIGGKK